MRESRSSGFVRGAACKGCPYLDWRFLNSEILNAGICASGFLMGWRGGALTGREPGSTPVERVEFL